MHLGIIHYFDFDWIPYVQPRSTDFLAGALLLARVSVALEPLNLLQQTSARAPELLGSCSFCFFAIPKTNQKQLIVSEFPIYF